MYMYSVCTMHSCWLRTVHCIYTYGMQCKYNIHCTCTWKLGTLSTAIVILLSIRILWVPNCYLQTHSVGLCVTYLCVTCSTGETRRRGLPLWIREQLEKLERQKVKELEREAQEAARRDHTSHASWRTELEEEEEEEEMERRRRKSRGSLKRREPSPPLQRHSHYRSRSSHKVS